jgi:putative transposase
LTDHIDELRAAVAKARRSQPFHIDGWVVLPEHMHCIWTLPEGDSNYAARWKPGRVGTFFVPTRTKEHERRRL